jgi:hypothetical protein
MEPLNTTYRCKEVTENPARYGEHTAVMERSDGTAGWFTITGSDASGLEAGKEYVISCKPANQAYDQC